MIAARTLKHSLGGRQSFSQLWCNEESERNNKMMSNHDKCTQFVQWQRAIKTFRLPLGSAESPQLTQQVDVSVPPLTWVLTRDKYKPSG